MLEVLIELLKMRARWWRVDGDGKVEGGRGRRVRVEGREGGGGGDVEGGWLGGGCAGPRFGYALGRRKGGGRGGGWPRKWACPSENS